jgi:hypothetical protein
LLQSRYGGQSQTLIQRIKQHNNPSSTTHMAGLRQLIFPDFQHNPDLPLKPGASGLIYASREDIQGHSFSLFVRCTETKNAVWKYLGEYKTEKCGTMTTQHFRSLSDKVSNILGITAQAMTWCPRPGASCLGQAYTWIQIIAIPGIYRNAGEDRTAEEWSPAFRRPHPSARGERIESSEGLQTQHKIA